MSLKSLISNYSAYNAWANQRIVKWLRTLDMEILYRPVLSSYPSLDYTMQHINRSQKFWLLFITEQDTADFSWKVRQGEAELILNEVAAYADQMRDRFSEFTQAELEEVLHLKSTWIENQRPRYEYILHIINHGTYHRGQIITIARTLGVTEGIPNTDFNYFDERER